MAATAVSPRTATAVKLRAAVASEVRAASPVLVGAAVVLTVAGVAVRFVSTGGLWLDEAQTVAIARLPLGQIPHALSQDGSPPLYYLLLHFWMDLVGTGTWAVRALSGVIAVAALPFFWLAGRRIGGRRGAWVAFLLAVSNPFAIAYATSVRMYSLMILCALLGYLAVVRAVERPSPWRLAAVAAVTAALLYTHYWGLYLVLVTGAWLAWEVRRRRVHVRVLAAVGVGVVAWLPWAPVFAFQARHTGTPWTSPARPSALLSVVAGFSGGGSRGGLLGLVTVSLFVTGAVVAVRRGRDPELGPAARRVGRETGILAGIAVATLLLAVVLGAIGHAAFVSRYTAVVLPLYLLVVAAGAVALPDRRWVAGCTAVVCVAGILIGYGDNRQQRTQAVQVAAALNAQARPGDLVVYCPDQLGPAMSRLLRVPGLREVTFPRGTGPQRVDWVDYRKVVERTNVAGFASGALSGLSAGSTVWMVWRNGYGGLAEDCGYLAGAFGRVVAPGTTVVREDKSAYYEYENLTRFSRSGG